MVLPSGITGFHKRGDVPLAVTDVAAFRAHCHEAARRASGRVVSITGPYTSDHYRNYAVGVLALPAGRIAVLLNAHHPIVTFAEPPGEGEVLLRFRECPVLAEVFGSFGQYQVVPAAQLEQPATSGSLRELTDIEREQLSYWKPKRVGDVVFNWWD